MELMVLVGADDVRAGGNAAREAGHEMSRAAGQIESALYQHQRFLDDWLIRFTDALEKAAAIRSATKDKK